MCQTANTCLTAGTGVASSILAWFHTFVETDQEIISTDILLPFADSRRVVVSYKRKYGHNLLVRHAQKKSVVRQTDHPGMTMAAD